MSSSGMTFEEMSESITGFDEIAVEKSMGFDLYADGERKPVALIRALVFIHQRRAGLSDSDAREKALSMTVRQLNDYFDASNDIDPEGDADTPSGEGVGASVIGPPTSLPSAC